ncbi:MAG: flagellar export chaperone FliS [Phycisphaeraceae bacterium]|nr:flagellar export chaperone FliS [Phycisphaerales bacterium]MCB9861015.1 flagellar export chaperone FliS [Phycisphaeraceae bacterium]
MNDHMSQATDQGANAYLRTRVMTASREELRLMLLEGAIRFARNGRDGLAEKNYEKSFDGISKCREIITELIASMRPEHDPLLCERVRAVYTFMFNELIEANLQKSPERVDAVIELLEYERETWVMLMDKLREERGEEPVHASGAETRPSREDPAAKLGAYGRPTAGYGQSGSATRAPISFEA